MKARRIVASTVVLTLLLGAGLFAQTAPGALRTANATDPAMGAAGAPFSKLMLPEKLGDAAGFFQDFWKDPEFSAKLKLTDSQKKQLQAAATAQRLELIDEGADAMKSFVRISAILNAEPFDQAAYKKEADGMAATASKTVGTLAEMVASRRRILTDEQYATLCKLQRARKREARRRREAERWKMRQRMYHRRSAHPRIPSSLSQPLE